MKSASTHLEALRALLNRFNTDSGDVVIGKMIPELAALMVALSDDLDKAQRSVVRLTWALLVLTLVLAVIGVAQFVATYQAPPIVTPAAVQSNDNEPVGGSIPAHVVLIGRDSIQLPKAQWAPMVNEQPTVAENFEAVDRKPGHAFPQVLTIFKLPMSDDRKVGVQISREEYVEAFVVHPGKVTIQVRVDRGRYWLLSRETFDLQSKLSVDITRYRPQLPVAEQRVLIQAFQPQIDAARAWMNADL